MTAHVETPVILPTASALSVAPFAPLTPGPIVWGWDPHEVWRTRIKALQEQAPTHALEDSSPK